VHHLKGGSMVYIGSPHRPSIDLKYHGKVGEHESIHTNLAQLIGQSMMIICHTFPKLRFYWEHGILSL
jgi:hypothetical protein